VINSYCRNSGDCSQDPIVNRALDILTSQLGTSCEEHETLQESRKIVLALKAIGNIGVVSKSVTTSKAELCFQQKSNPVDIRLAAIDAYRRLSCSGFSTAPFLRLYSTANENTEIRISSYLTVMRCATPKVIEVVKNVLHDEEVNQGNYNYYCRSSY
jgi:hypothetical protein